MKQLYFVVKKLNFLVSIVLVILAGFIMGLPFLPEVIFQINKIGFVDEAAAAQNPAEQGNFLIIPSIMVNAGIYEGANEKTMNKGVWRRPHSSTPEKPGNTVFVAHRFLYTNGSKTFYHLNKIKRGDDIVIYWQSRKYEYVVTEVFEVGKNDSWIEESTPDSVITLYTCTPLWTAEKRLVVRAVLTK